MLDRKILTWEGYRTTTIMLKLFQDAFKEYPDQEENVHPVIHKAGKDAIEYKIRDFTWALEDFELRHPETQ